MTRFFGFWRSEWAPKHAKWGSNTCIETHICRHKHAQKEQICVNRPVEGPLWGVQGLFLADPPRMGPEPPCTGPVQACTGGVQGAPVLNQLILKNVRKGHRWHT